MAKRFFNTQTIEEDWYINLSLKHRELLRYCESKCDGAGIFSFHPKIASTYIGEKVTEKDLDSIRVSKLTNGKYFLIGYCYFQNGNLSDKSPAHKPIFKSLLDNKVEEKTLYDSLSNRLQEKETGKEEEIEIEKGKDKGDEIKNEIPFEIEFLDYCKELLKEKYSSFEFSLKSKYKTWVDDNWKDGNGKKISNWKNKINNTIPFLKPELDKKPNIISRYNVTGQDYTKKF